MNATPEMLAAFEQKGKIVFRCSIEQITAALKSLKAGEKTEGRRPGDENYFIPSAHTVVHISGDGNCAVIHIYPRQDNLTGFNIYVNRYYGTATHDCVVLSTQEAIEAAGFIDRNYLILGRPGCDSVLFRPIFRA